MWKVFLIWLAVLVIGFFIVGLAGQNRYDNLAKSLTNILMWTLILGGIGFLSMCVGGDAGGSCDYSRNGAVCEPG